MDDLDRKIAGEAARAFSEWIDERAALFPDINVWPPAACDSERAGMRALLRAVVRLCDARYQPRADAPCRHGTNSCRLRGLEHDRDRCIVSGQPRADVKPDVCPKCGGGEVSVSYCNGRGWDHHNHWMAGVKEGVEHLERRCKGCRYWWSEPCIADEARADVKPDAPASTCDCQPPAIAGPCALHGAPDDATEEAVGIVVQGAGWSNAESLRRYIDAAPDSNTTILVHAIAAALRRRSEVRIGTGAIARTLLHTSPNGCQWFGSREPDGHAQIEWRTQERAAGMAIDPAAFRALVALVARDGEGSR